MLPPPIANTAPPFAWLGSDTESLKLSAVSDTLPPKVLGVGISFIELVISLPVPNINEPLLFCVLFAIPTTLLATPDVVLSLVFDSILFNVPTTTAPVFCIAYSLPLSPLLFIYLVDIILYEPKLVAKLPLIYEFEPTDVSPVPEAG